MTKMKPLCAATILLGLFALAIPGYAQLDLFSTEQRTEFTPDWHGDRFADGRPNVPDSVLVRLKDATADEAWDVLQDAQYSNQFEGGWRVINPGPRLVGRVVTAVFMPRRPDVDSVIQANGKKENRDEQIRGKLYHSNTGAACRAARFRSLFCPAWLFLLSPLWHQGLADDVYLLR